MITHLRVQNFRKHKDIAVDFQPGPILITGPNGSGKTSLAEAIYISLQGKSWRSGFADIVRSSTHDEWWRVDIEFDDGEKRTVKFNNHAAKTFEINGESHIRLPSRLKKPVILFEPGDLQLLYGSPARRREFFDRFISQVDPEYSVHLRKFARVLMQRNNLLKYGATEDALFAWDIQFANLAEQIIKARISWLEKINQRVTAHYQNIAGTADTIEVLYSSGSKTKNQILKQLEIDSHNGVAFTRFGPQTHDVYILINQHTAKATASRGENRTILFAILYSMMDLMNEELPGENYLILDDIDSELDAERKKRLYSEETSKKNPLIATTIETTEKIKNHLQLR